jgi:hypothetical protein
MRACYGSGLPHQCSPFHLLGISRCLDGQNNDCIQANDLFCLLIGAMLLGGLQMNLYQVYLNLVTHCTRMVQFICIIQEDDMEHLSITRQWHDSSSVHYLRLLNRCECDVNALNIQYQYAQGTTQNMQGIWQTFQALLRYGIRCKATN